MVHGEKYMGTVSFRDMGIDVVKRDRFGSVEWSWG